MACPGNDSPTSPKAEVPDDGSTPSLKWPSEPADSCLQCHTAQSLHKLRLRAIQEARARHMKIFGIAGATVGALGGIVLLVATTPESEGALAVLETVDMWEALSFSPLDQYMLIGTSGGFIGFGLGEGAGVVVPVSFGNGVY